MRTRNSAVTVTRFAKKALVGRAWADWATSIPDVLKGTVRDLRRGCYSFGDVLDLAAHHLVWTGEATEVEARLRNGAVTVRAFLRERYGVFSGDGEHGDKSDLRRFRLWLADARWRVRRFRAEEKRRACWRRVTAWNATAPAMAM